MPTMKKFYLPAPSLRGETAAYTFLGLAGVASLLLAATAMFDFVNGKRSIIANLENPPSVQATAVCSAPSTNANRASGEAPTVRSEAATRANTSGVVPVSFDTGRAGTRS